MKIFFTIFLLFPLWVSANDQVIHHSLQIKLDIEGARVSVKDKITLPVEMQAKELRFFLRQDYKLKSIPGMKIGQNAMAGDGISLVPYTVKLSNSNSLVLQYEIPFTKKSEAEIDAGAVSEKGIYLTGDQYWYALFEYEPKTYLTYDMRLDFPPGWQSVSQGTVQGLDRDIQQEQIHLVALKAQPYWLKTMGVKIGVMLKNKNDAMADRLLDLASDYLSLYQTLLGHYPYKKFILLETDKEAQAYPSFSLVDVNNLENDQLAYLMVQNWFGHGVYVDVQQGDWSKPLARYLSYHLVAEQKQLAHNMRSALLEKINLYNHQETLSVLDALAQNETNQTVMDKTFMFFHSLRRELDDDEFIKVLQSLYQRHKHHRIDLDGIEKVVSRVSGRNFVYFFRQWLQRPGLPQFSLADVELLDQNNYFQLRLTIDQLQNHATYRVPLPVKIVLENNEHIQKTLIHDQASKELLINVPVRPLYVALDPFYQVNRHVYESSDSSETLMTRRLHESADKNEHGLSMQSSDPALINEFPWYFSEGRMERHLLALKALPVEDRINYIAMQFHRFGLKLDEREHSISAYHPGSIVQDRLVMSAQYNDSNLLSLAMLLEYARSVTNKTWVNKMVFFSSYGDRGANHIHSLSKKFNIMAMLNLHGLEESAFPIYAFAAGSSPQWSHILHMVSRIKRQNIQSFQNEYSMGLQRDFIANSIPALQIIAGKNALNVKPEYVVREKPHYKNWSRLAGVLHEISQHLNHRKEELPAQTLAFAPYVPSEIISKPLGLIAYQRKGNGIRISVQQDSPAFTAGLRSGDIIVQLNRTDITDLDSYLNTMRNLKSGQGVAIKFLRTGRLMEANAKLVAR